MDYQDEIITRGSSHRSLPSATILELKKAQLLSKVEKLRLSRPGFAPSSEIKLPRFMDKLLGMFNHSPILNE